MKYKAGDKVKIVSEPTENMDPIGEMDVYLGKIMTIIGFYGNSYIMKEDDGQWFWDDDMIERRADILKTWEIFKLIDENPNRMEGKKFKLIKDCGNTYLINVGEVAETAKTINGVYGLFIDEIKLNLSGFEIWEEVKEKPMSFNELINTMGDKQKIKAEHELLQSKYGGYFEGELSVLLHRLGVHYYVSEILEILTEGKFYIED